MKKYRASKSWVVAVQFMILIAAPVLTRPQSPAPQMIEPSASSGTQSDPYAETFAGLNYTEKQKEAIAKIQQDIAARKAVVVKSDQLTQDQKDAMLTGYTRMEYNLIYKELTPAQQKKVSTRWRAHQAAEQAAKKPQAPGQ